MPPDGARALVRSHGTIVHVVPPLAVLLAEPHARLRDAIAALLAHEEGIHVLGSVGSVHEAATAMRRGRPDVLVTDLALVSIGAGRLLGAWGPVDAAVPVVVTGFEAPATMEPPLLARGATAYVPKDRLTDRLPAVLRQLARLELVDGVRTQRA